MICKGCRHQLGAVRPEDVDRVTAKGAVFGKYCKRCNTYTFRYLQRRKIKPAVWNAII